MAARNWRSTASPVYLDVEGLPDRDFYYLIGLRVKTAKGIVQHSLWADSAGRREAIWRDFLDVLSSIENPVLIHYGSYETTFLRRMSERYGGPSEGSVVARVLASPLNLLSRIFARIYFPTYGNGLKDRAKFVRLRMDGNKCVRCTRQWSGARNGRDRTKPRRSSTLINYNAEDCEALQKLTEFVSSPSLLSAGHEEQEATSAVNVDSLPLPSGLKFGNVQFQLPEFDAINKAAYWDYQRERILVRSSERLKRIAEKASKPKKINPRANKTVVWPGPTRCPKCNREEILQAL